MFLLQDERGTVVRALEQEFNNNANRINFAILQNWLQGKGKQPVMWGTLVEVLRDCGLRYLADNIKDIKMT